VGAAFAASLVVGTFNTSPGYSGLVGVSWFSVNRSRKPTFNFLAMPSR
jgi:hypothetical protein